MKRTKTTFRGNEGVALLTALGLLFVFSMLGAAYVTYMTTVADRANLDLRVLRARHMARGAVQVAVGKIQAALMTDPAQAIPPDPFTVDFPVYTLDRTSSTGFSKQDNVRVAAEVTIAAEKTGNTDLGTGSGNTGPPPRSFRIVSQATIANLGPNSSEYRRNRARVETVVVFNVDGSAQTLFWSEAPEHRE